MRHDSIEPIHASKVKESSKEEICLGSQIGACPIHNVSDKRAIQTEHFLIYPQHQTASSSKPPSNSSARRKYPKGMVGVICTKGGSGLVEWVSRLSDTLSFPPSTQKPSQSVTYIDQAVSVHMASAIQSECHLQQEPERGARDRKLAWKCNCKVASAACVTR